MNGAFPSSELADRARWIGFVVVLVSAVAMFAARSGPRREAGVSGLESLRDHRWSAHAHSE